MGEWLGHSLAVLGVDGSSLLTASQKYDGLNSTYASLLGSIHIGGLKEDTCHTQARVR